jgi:hypothetical protein
MIRTLFSIAKTFVVVKTVDAVIAAFTKPRAAKGKSALAATARKPASKSKPHRAAAKRRAATA